MSGKSAKPNDKPARKVGQHLRSNDSSEQIATRRFGKTPRQETSVPSDRKHSFVPPSRSIRVAPRDSAEESVGGKHFSLEDFDILKSLGKGSFGQVKLIRHRKTHMLYALKIL